MASNSNPPFTSNPRSQPIKFSVEILDYIFAFLKSDSQSLIACSKAHPSLSPIVERHIYYHIVIPTLPDYQTTGRGYCLESSHLIKLLSETPQIANRVRILRIAFCRQSHRHSCGEIALLLPIFSALECLILTAESDISWEWALLPETLTTAVRICLYLPTMQEVYIGALRFPLDVLSTNTNIKCLSLSGPSEISDYQDGTDAYPQLESLTVEDIDEHLCEPIWDWAKPYVVKLHSLKCDYSSVGETMLLEVLQICSGTLNNLDLRLEPLCGVSSRFGT